MSLFICTNLPSVVTGLGLCLDIVGALVILLYHHPQNYSAVHGEWTEPSWPDELRKRKLNILRTNCGVFLLLFGFTLQLFALFLKPSIPAQ